MLDQVRWTMLPAEEFWFFESLKNFENSYPWESLKTDIGCKIVAVLSSVHAIQFRLTCNVYKQQIN